MALRLTDPGASRTRRPLDDRGIALPMVLVVFVVGVALIGAFLVAIVGSAQVSDTTRSGIQAQAAAEAGLAAALVEIGESDPCQFGGVSSQSGVIYTVEAHTAACGATSNASITLVSTGRSGDATARVEATYPVVTGAGSTVEQRVRGFSIMNLSGGWPNMTIVSADPAKKLSLTFAEGNYNCWNKRTIDGDLIVSNGTASIGGKCKVTGNVIASGDVTVNDGTVGLNVTSSGKVTMYSSAVVGGTVWAGQAVIVNNSYVGGDVRAASTEKKGAQCKTGKSSASVGGTAPGGRQYLVDGQVIAGGCVYTWQDNVVRGGISANSSVPQPPAAPQGAWIESGPLPSTWTSNGYVLGTTSGCSSNDDLISKINSATVPTVFVCSSAINLWQAATVNLKTNVAVIASKGGNVSGRLTVSSSGNQPRNFSLLAPDGNSSDAAPTCSNGALIISGGIDAKSPVTMLLYSPCLISLGGGEIHGAVVAGSINVYNDPKLVVSSLSVPGINLDISVDEEGYPVTGTGSPKLEEGAQTLPSTQRDIN